MALLANLLLDNWILFVMLALMAWACHATGCLVRTS